MLESDRTRQREAGEADARRGETPPRRPASTVPPGTPVTSHAAGRTGSTTPVADGDADMASSTFPNLPVRTRRMRALGILGSALIAGTLATGSASATIVDRETFA